MRASRPCLTTRPGTRASSKAPVARRDRCLDPPILVDLDLICDVRAVDALCWRGRSTGFCSVGFLCAMASAAGATEAAACAAALLSSVGKQVVAPELRFRRPISRRIRGLTVVPWAVVAVRRLSQSTMPSSVTSLLRAKSATAATSHWDQALSARLTVESSQMRIPTSSPALMPPGRQSRRSRRTSPNVIRLLAAVWVTKS